MPQPDPRLSRRHHLPPLAPARAEAQRLPAPPFALPLDLVLFALAVVLLVWG